MEALTTLNLPTPAGKEAIRQGLAAAMNAFIASGGRVNQVDGFEGVMPLRERREVPASYKPKRQHIAPKKHRMTPEREADLVRQLKEAAAAGKTRTTARDEAHIGQMLFMCLCLEHGIEFKQATDLRQQANREKSTKATAARAALAPKVQAYAHMGVIACAAMLKVSDAHVRKIAREHGIAIKGLD